LRNGGITGLGQTPGADDVNDSFKVLNAWINELNLERRVMVNTVVLPTFPDLTTDVSFWTPYEHVLLTSMSVRLRQIYALPPVDLDVQLALSALKAFQAINLQQISYVPEDYEPFTVTSLVRLALRAAGRVTDIQQVDPLSQDFHEAVLLMAEMIEEWERERQVRVIPGDLPDVLVDFDTPITGDFLPGTRNAIILNLAVRLRDLWGQEVPKILQDRADRALSLIQAINLQQFPVPVEFDLSSISYILNLALREAGRINDEQHAIGGSYDFVAAQYHAVQMIEEWKREREVFVIPGDLPDFSGDPVLPPAGTFDSGVKNAIVLNLGVRLQDVFGLPANPALQTRADKALKLIQAINAQQIAPLATGVPATVRQACVLALRLAGRINDQQRVSDTSTDMNDATSLLVMMLGQWQRKRWLVWNEAETAKVSTGSQWYSVGPGGDFNMPRPDKLHGGFVRFQPFAGPNPVDIPLAIIEAKEDWGKITIKDLKSIPEVMFYDSAFPMGRVTFYPVPPSGLYELHIFTKAQLPVYVHLTDQLLVPPEYLDAIVNNLALRLPGAQITPLLLGQARASLETIRLANAQISTLSLPGILGGRGGDVSSWSGRGLNRAWIVGSEAVL
jgi:hypothetical protein